MMLKYLVPALSLLIGFSAIACAPPSPVNRASTLPLDAPGTPPDAPANPIQDRRLRDAVLRSDLEAATAALTKGANPNTGDIYDGYPLTLAAHLGDVDMVRLLVEQDADVNIQTDQGYTALMEAVLIEHQPTVQFLLDQGADPNRYSAGVTPLAAAVEAGNLGIVQILLAAGADAQQRSQGQTLRAIAEEMGDPEMLALIEAAESNLEE